MDTFLAHTSTYMHTPILISYFFFYPACFMIRLHRTHTTWAYDTPARGVRIKGLFPDDFVESPSLFKRNGYYYLTYGNDYSHPLSITWNMCSRGPSRVFTFKKGRGGRGGGLPATFGACRCICDSTLCLLCVILSRQLLLRLLRRRWPGGVQSESGRRSLRSSQ